MSAARPIAEIFGAGDRVAISVHGGPFVAGTIEGSARAGMALRSHPESSALSAKISPAVAAELVAYAALKCELACVALQAGRIPYATREIAKAIDTLAQVSGRTS